MVLCTNPLLGEIQHGIDEVFFKKNQTELCFVYNAITAKLNKYPNFKGVYFKMLRDGNFEVQLLHKTAYGSYACRYFVNDDRTNIESIIEQCEKDWLEKDNEEAIKAYYQKFVEDLIDNCDKWGYE